MIVHNDFGRKKIELTEDELIIYRLFWKKRIKKENIKSAFIVDDFFLVVRTNDEKVTTAGNEFLRWTDKEILKRIVDEINKEDVIFPSNRENFSTLLILFVNIVNAFMLSLNRSSIEVKYIFYVIGILNLILLFHFIFMIYNYNNALYDIDSNELKIIKNKNIIDKISLKDISFSIPKNNKTIFVLKTGKYKFYFRSNVTYPLKHKNFIEELIMEKMAEIKK